MDLAVYDLNSTKAATIIGMGLLISVGPAFTITHVS